jgi:catechol 2,3-dioxygenase-like lactoylglutathione lyase family enzyme
MTPSNILETIIYAEDLTAARNFYRDVMGLEPVSTAPGRHLFYRIGNQMLLVFNPEATSRPSASAELPVPAHGGRGPGHICFRATAEDLEAWRGLLEAKGVAIEADFEWPKGGRSIYFRDPAGNSIEIAEARIWGLA